MKKKMSKSRLAITLSKLEGFRHPKVSVEQYLMDSEIGAEALWNAMLMGDLGGKVSVDFGCGTGILGIGALILGARAVYFVDSDNEALEIAKNNYNKLKSEGLIEGEAMFLCQDVSLFNEKADVVLQNPPFGTKVRHADRLFLEKAVKTAPVIWTFHKSDTKVFIKAFCRDNKVSITNVYDFEFPIKSSYKFHKRRIHRIKVSAFRLSK